MVTAAAAADVLAGSARWTCLVGHATTGLQTLPDGCAQMCLTSPPYLGQRDYGTSPIDWPETSYVPMSGLPSVTVPAMASCLGNESSTSAYVAHLLTVLREVRRTLADDGTLWLNLADTYNSGSSGGTGGSTMTGGTRNQAVSNRHGRRVLKEVCAKNLLGIPWRVALALQADGWWLRNDIVISRPNAVPENVADRMTRSHEYVFLFSKSAKYFYDGDAIAEPSRHPGDPRNARDVWPINSEGYDGAHFAVMPPELARRCVVAGSRKGDVVVDPFGGSGTTALIAVGNGRRAIMCELNQEDEVLMRERLAGVNVGVTGPLRPAVADHGPLFVGVR